MSYQRAVVNCKRCFGLGNKGFFNDSYDSKTDRLVNVPLWTARNEAMQSLELELDGDSTGTEFSTEELQRKSRRALTTCMNCQYKRPEIAEIFNLSD